MKKGLILILGGSLLLGSCGSYEAAGAYTGSMFGDMIGSAIGGISGGWRGQQIGSLIGTLGGAAAGAAIGEAQDRAQERRFEDYAARRARSRRQQATRQQVSQQPSGTYYDNGYNGTADDSGFDPQGRGDDRITFDGGSGTPTTQTPAPGTQMPATSFQTPPAGSQSLTATNGPVLLIRHAGVFEDEHDGVLTRGEKCTVVFEIVNNSNQPVYDVFPLVEEATGNKHIHISPNLRVESIAPHNAIRYSATLLADNRLRDGQIEVRVGVAQGNTLIQSQTRQFSVPTRKYKSAAARE